MSFGKITLGKVLEYAAIGIIGLAIVGTIFTALVCGVMGAVYLVLTL